MNLEWTEVNEEARRYIFPNGEIVLADVKRLCVRPSGTHRVETGDGKKWVVAPGWLAVEIEVEHWSL